MAKTEEKATTTELALAQSYPLAKNDLANFAQAMRDNLGGEEISPMDLVRLKVPSGGATVWTLETEAGEEDAKEIDGVIIYSAKQRIFWRDAFSGGSTPPDCFAEDGITGHGDPGGECSSCPNAQFGTGNNGRGQACKMRWLLFLARPGNVLPMVIDVPPSSLKAVRQYMLKLTSAGTLAATVVTGLALEKDKNQDGIAYSKVKLHTVAKVDDPEYFLAYANAIRPFLGAAAKTMASEAEPMDQAA